MKFRVPKASTVPLQDAEWLLKWTSRVDISGLLGFVVDVKGSQCFGLTPEEMGLPPLGLRRRVQSLIARAEVLRCKRAA